MLPTASELPADILRLIFELLAQPDVLSTAAVSRAWRSCAVLDVNYYRACSYLLPHYGFWGDQPHRGRHNNVAQYLTEIVDDAAAHRYKLSLSLGPRRRNDGELVRSGAHAEPGLDDGVAWFQTEVAPVVRCAVHLLVRLNLFLEAEFASVLLAMLTVPAPHLRSLAICITTAGQPELPSDLFAGASPLLREARILDTAPLLPPYVCFSNVLEVSLSIIPTVAHMAAAAASFPMVKSLTIHSNTFTMAPVPPLPAGSMDAFRRVDSLCISGRTQVHNMLPALLSVTSSLPTLAFHYVSHPDAVAQLLMVPLPQCLELHERVAAPERGRYGTWTRQRVQVRICLETGATSRTVDVPLGYEPDALAALRLSGAAATLTAITVDDRLVRGMMRACRALPALKQLGVVLSLWCNATVHTFFSAPPPAACPHLETLTLHATRPGATLIATIIATLLSALGPARPHLVLKNGLAIVGRVPETLVASVWRRDTEFFPSAHAARARMLVAERDPGSAA